MSDEIFDDFNNTLNALIQRLSSALDQLILEMNSILSLFDNHNVELERLKLFSENLSKTVFSNVFDAGLLSDLMKQFKDSLNSYTSVFRELYDSYNRLVEASNLFKENFKSALSSVLKNFTFMLGDWRCERSRLVEERDSLNRALAGLQAEKATLLDENKRLASNLRDLQASYDSLNTRFNELERDYNLSLQRAEILRESNLRLERDFETVRSRFNAVIEGFNRVYNLFKNFSNSDLNLPSSLLLKSIREPFDFEQLNIFFRNFETVIELDGSLLKSYARSKSFKTALTGSYYSEILSRVFKNILDVEEEKYGLIERRICEVEALINDSQQSRYLYTELFKPFIKTARNLLASNQSLLAEAALQIAELVKFKFEDADLRRTLIRRTGIRGLNLDDCAVGVSEIPLDVDAVNVSVNNLLEALNSEIFERRRDLSTFFFEAWRDAALKYMSDNKIVCYVVLSIVKRLLERAGLKDSDLHKLFKKSLILV